MDAADAEQELWNAVEARDAAFDGRFVFAVVTTGVYCLASCPARRPLRRNVRFFSRPRAARDAGFRSCKRCKPDRHWASADDSTVQRAIDHLELHTEEHTSLDDLGAVVGLSPFHLQRRFKERTGMSPKEFATQLRLRRFRQRVKRGEDVSSATYGAGFGSSRGLYERARSNLGMTPAQYARGGAGLALTVHLRDTSLGRCLIATTADGVCAVLLGDDDAALREELEHEFRDASFVGVADSRAPVWVDAVVRHLDDVHVPLAAPLDLQGTPFQIRVWRALRGIAPGQRRSYSQLAAAIGSPEAVRAVGRACGQNTIAVLVPCHRVVRKDGTSGGYRWGVQRKRRLLERETPS